MKRVNIFLIAVTLIAGMMGCQPALYPAFDPFRHLVRPLHTPSTFPAPLEVRLLPQLMKRTP